MYVTAATLVAQGASATTAARLAPLLNTYFAKYGIFDPYQISMLLGQFAHETAGYGSIVEGMGRCSGYGGGCDYRGRGLVHLTHESNYRAYTNYVNARLGQFGLVRPVNFVSSPADVADVPFCVDVAFFYLFEQDATRAAQVREALSTRNHRALGLTIWAPAWAGTELRGGKVLSASQEKTFGDASRQARAARALAPLQTEYLAFQQRQRPEPVLATGPLPLPSVTSLPRSPFDPPPGTAPPIASLPPRPVTAGGAGGGLTDLFRIFLPGTSTPPAPGAGGSWLAGQTGTPGLRLNLDAPAPGTQQGGGSQTGGGAQASTQARQQDKGYDLMARLQQIKPEHMIALVGLGFLLIKPNLKRRRELLR